MLPKNIAAHPIQNKIISYFSSCGHNLHCTHFQTYITGPRQSVVPEIEIFDEAYMWILFCIAGTTDFGIIMLAPTTRMDLFIAQVLLLPHYFAPGDIKRWRLPSQAHVFKTEAFGKKGLSSPSLCER